MRTKSILFAAALAASAIPAVAQNVYSLNVVGYVNVVLQPTAFTFIANPLKSPDNNITNLFPASAIADGSYILTWDSVANNFAGGSPYFYGAPDNVWDPQISLSPGQGFFFYNASSKAITNTFVGEVVQGSSTNVLVGNGFTMLGSTAPVGGNFTNSIDGLVPVDSDHILTWDSALNTWSGISPYYYGAPDNVWDPADVNLAVGQGFFYYHNGANYTWIRNFTVN